MSSTDGPLPTDAGLLRQHQITRSFPTLRTVAALMLREMSTRFGRKPGGYIWALLQPLGQILVLALAFSLLARTPALGTSFILFKATGMLPFQMFRIPSRMVENALTFSRPLLKYPGVTWVDAVLARFILNTLVQIIVAILILGGVLFYEQINLIFDWPMILGSAGLTAILALGIGVMNIYLSERFDVFDNIWGIMTAPLMIVSGVLFLYDDLPQVAQDILWYNPLVHTVGMMRAGFYSVYQPQYISVPYVLGCAMIPLVLGIILMRRHHRTLLQR